MSLMNRYIAEVGRHLPEKDRSDIEAEIRSMIEDTLEERWERGHTPTSADDEVIAETLERLGDPKLLAYKYTPPKRYLIGPDWYEGYLKVLQRVLFMALPVFAVATFIVTLTQDPLDFINAIGEAVGGAFSVGIQILFWVTLVFVLLERSDEKPDDLPKSNSRTWTIARLPKMPRTRQISVVETVINIAVLLFLLIWIALPFALDRLQGHPLTVPILHPNLWNFWLPVFFIIMALTLVHEVFKLKIGNWTPALTAANVILGLVSIVYIAALVTSQDVINPEFLASLDNTTGSAELRETVRWSIGISAAVVAGIYVWSMIDSIRLSRKLKQIS
jgi:hypothetical protein